MLKAHQLWKVSMKSILVTIILKPINRHLLIGPDAYPLESIKLHIYWAAGFSPSILVTKNRLHRNFPEQVCFQHEICMICCKYNSVSDSSMKFTRFGVSSYTCNSDFAVDYSN